MLKEKMLHCDSGKSDKKLYTESSSEALQMKRISSCDVRIGKFNTQVYSYLWPW